MKALVLALVSILIAEVCGRALACIPWLRSRLGPSGLVCGPLKSSSSVQRVQRRIGRPFLYGTPLPTRRLPTCRVWLIPSCSRRISRSTPRPAKATTFPKARASPPSPPPWPPPPSSSAYGMAPHPTTFSPPTWRRRTTLPPAAT
jgi:hypothetical protein